MIPAPSIELRDFRLVRAIFQAGRATAASKLLGLSQPAVSHQLRSLEERLGREVFEREGRGLRITRVGERLLSLSHEVLEAVVDLGMELQRDSACPTEKLRLATQCYTAYHWLLQAMTELSHQHAHVRIDIVPEVTRDPRTALADGKLDLALCTGHSRATGPIASGASLRTRWCWW